MPLKNSFEVQLDSALGLLSETGIMFEADTDDLQSTNEPSLGPSKGPSLGPKKGCMPKAKKKKRPNKRL